MAPLLLMVFHLILCSLMIHLSLLVSLDIQSSTIKGRQYPTSRYRYSTINQLQSQNYITSMINLNGTLNNIHRINKLQELHLQYQIQSNGTLTYIYIIYQHLMVKLLLRKCALRKYAVSNFMVQMCKNILIHIDDTQHIIIYLMNNIINNKFKALHHIHYHTIYQVKTMLEVVKLYTISYYLWYSKIHKISNKLLLLVYIYLFLKERRIFILIISMVQQN
eukprot:541013_1